MVLLALTLALVPQSDYAAAFDAHWEALRDGYPYFELYGVDWEVERAEHRPRAIEAANPNEFAWELARLVSALPDPHVSFRPAIDTIAGRWSYLDLDAAWVERKLLVLTWPADHVPAGIPEAFADDPLAYPEIVTIGGESPLGAGEILAAGPLGTPFGFRLRWPDGSETQHELMRPLVSNLPPPKKHYGKDWLVTGRVGTIGYLGVRTFSPEKATLGPDGKMTTMLRAALKELRDTTGILLDLQGNGGGLVQASDPFLGNLIEKKLSYRWGNTKGRSRVIRPRRPRYRMPIVAVVDEGSASGGEWTARILRDAGRATVLGGRTQGAEAAVLKSTAPDGSVINYSGQPMIEPGRKPFQEVGIERDIELDLTVEDVRRLGYDEARERIRRARFARALEILGGPEDGVDELLELAERGVSGR